MRLPRLTIDVDGTVVRTGATVAWAFRGFNPHHRKDPSYYPLLAHLAQTGHILRCKNRPVQGVSVQEQVLGVGVMLIAQRELNSATLPAPSPPTRSGGLGASVLSWLFAYLGAWKHADLFNPTTG